MIRAYTGKTGSGKTYLMVKEAFLFWKKGINIYSNTKLDFERQIKANFITRIWHKVKKTEFGKISYFENINEILHVSDGLIIFDEAQVLFNARLWESLPEEFQYKLQQHRKHNIDLFCTTQNMGTIDITYRRLVHSWIHCKNLFQLGKSPKIIFGLFKQEFKDVDQLYNSVDDLVVDTLKTKFFTIHFWSKTLYDTMYDIGFRRFKIVWLNSLDEKLRRKKLYMILPKKMSLSSAYRDIRLYNSLYGLKKLVNSQRS